MVRCKKKQFSTTYLYIADFIQVQKIAGQRLFYEFKTLYEPSVNENEEGEEGELKPVQLMHPLAKPVKLTSGTLENLNIPAAV